MGAVPEPSYVFVMKESRELFFIYVKKRQKQKGK
jgi:hypothetical protein